MKKAMTLAEWKKFCAAFREYGYNPYDSETGHEWSWYLHNTGAW